MVLAKAMWAARSCQPSQLRVLPKNEANTEDSKAEKWRNTSDDIEHLVFFSTLNKISPELPAKRGNKFLLVII